MLSQFKEFYGSIDMDINEIDDNTLLCFDTNVLLNIYRYSDVTRKKLLKAMEEVKENIFIPYHVGLEFNLQKKNILDSILNMEESITSKINESKVQYINGISKSLNENIKIKSADEKEIRRNIISELEKQINSTMDTWIKNELIKEFRLINTLDLKDEISNELAILLNGKVGPSYMQQKIDEIQLEGKDRYEKNIPPGYDDDKNSQKQDIIFYNDINYIKKYSDLIIWNQIMDHINSWNKSEANRNKISKVIFVTDDSTDDWIYIVSGKKKGVRAELRKEMLDKTNAFLHIKDTNGFLQLMLDIEEDLIQNAEVPNSLEGYHYKGIEEYFNNDPEVAAVNHEGIGHLNLQDNFFKLDEYDHSSKSKQIIELENRYIDIESGYEYITNRLKYLQEVGTEDLSEVLYWRSKMGTLYSELIQLKQSIDMLKNEKEPMTINDRMNLYRLDKKVVLVGRNIKDLLQELAGY